MILPSVVIGDRQNIVIERFVSGHYLGQTVLAVRVGGVGMKVGF